MNLIIARITKMITRADHKIKAEILLGQLIEKARIEATRDILMDLRADGQHTACELIEANYPTR